MKNTAIILNMLILVTILITIARTISSGLLTGLSLAFATLFPMIMGAPFWISFQSIDKGAYAAKRAIFLNYIVIGCVIVIGFMVFFSASRHSALLATPMEILLIGLVSIITPVINIRLFKVQISNQADSLDHSSDSVDGGGWEEKKHLDAIQLTKKNLLKKRMNEVALTGVLAYKNGLSIEDNPHSIDSDDHGFWMRGYALEKRRKG